MCQVNEDDMNSVLEAKPDFKVFKKCLKCDENSVVVTRVSEALCRDCFIEYVTHKFRATVGKNVKKLLERDESVLVPYSGSCSSVSMLHLIYKGVGDEAKKKFTFKPIILYIEDTLASNAQLDNNQRMELLKNIQKSIEYSNFQVYYSLLENSLLDTQVEESLLYSDDLEKLTFNDELRIKFRHLIDNVSNQTSKDELLKRFKLNLINRIAKSLRISKILFAVNCTKLTVDLLTNVAIGKGAHVSSEMAMDENVSGLVYIRPLRELTSKECAFYNTYTKLNDYVMSNNSSLLNPTNSSIYRLTEKFINGLQNDYPTTVSTIFRTSEKLTPSDDLIESNIKCLLCERPLDTKIDTTLASSAINDLEYSKSISRLDSNSNNKLSPWKHGESLLASKFCYSCSIVVNDLKKKSELPTFIKEKLRDDMRNQISDFLLDDKDD